MNSNGTHNTSNSKAEASENLHCSFIPAEGLTGTMIIVPRGTIDTYSVSYFKERLNIQIKQGHIRLVFDLNNIEYISAVGVVLFIQLLNDIRKEGGDIILTGLRKNVEDVFQLPGFSGFFTISNSVASALEIIKDNGNNL